MEKKKEKVEEEENNDIRTIAPDGKNFKRTAPAKPCRSRIASVTPLVTMTAAKNSHHAWSQATETGPDEAIRLGRTKIVDGYAPSGGSAAPVVVTVTPQETDHLVESLLPFPVEEVGSSSFLRMYACGLERLSTQAHASAAAGDGDEYVVEAVLTHGKVRALVRTLLAVEVWRTSVLKPCVVPGGASGCDRSEANPGEAGSTSGLEESSKEGLAALLARNSNVLRVAFTLHVETTIVGLLNLVLYRKECISELESDIAVALVDYCARRIVSTSKFTHTHWFHKIDRN